MPDLKQPTGCKRYLAHLFFEQEESGFMLTGKLFRLGERTLAIEVVYGKRRAVTVPAGAIFKVVPGLGDGQQTVDILWEGRILEIFTCDVNMRGTEIVNQSAKA
jgi:hypothetical protein